MASCHPKLSPLHLRACATRWGADCLGGADSIRTPIRTSETFPEDPPRPSQWPPLTERLTRRKDLRTHARWPFRLFRSLFRFCSIRCFTRWIALHVMPSDGALILPPDPHFIPVTPPRIVFVSAIIRARVCHCAGPHDYIRAQTHTGPPERVSPCFRKCGGLARATHTRTRIQLRSRNAIVPAHKADRMTPNTWVGYPSLPMVLWGKWGTYMGRGKGGKW